MPDALDPALVAELRAALDAALAGGLRDDPLEHAGQVAAVAGALWRAFQSVALECVLVGGSAIEVHAPGLYVTGDVDVVLDGSGRSGVRDTADAVLTALGFTRAGRHWTRGDLFVEVPSVTLDDPTELVRVGARRFRVVRKEVLLRDRIVGFLHWRQPAYGQQAIDLIAAFDAGELRRQLATRRAPARRGRRGLRRTPRAGNRRRPPCRRRRAGAAAGRVAAAATGRQDPLSAAIYLARMDRVPVPPPAAPPTDDVPDVSLRWGERLARVRRSQARTTVTGMTRPPRDPDERTFLAARGGLGPFAEHRNAAPDDHTA